MLENGIDMCEDQCISGSAATEFEAVGWNAEEEEMIRGLETNAEISAAQEQFEVAFELYVEDRYPVDIGYQGGKTRRMIIWMPALDLWAHFGTPPSEKGPPNRYWNVFGVGQPHGMVSIACEINPPKQARKHPPAGVFASESDGTLLVLHRGRFTVTGGMTLSFVRTHFMADWLSFLDRGKVNKAIRVASLPSDEFGSDVRSFVLEVMRIKELARYKL